ncbi:hypothetical protein RB597_004681 [Gaeumannomyces tritici]
MDGPEAATHYQVLGVSKQLLDNAKDAQPLVRLAYRRALLRHHPDKAAAATAAAAASSSSPPPPPPPPRRPQTHVPGGPGPGPGPSPPPPAFTVDQIAAAAAVLADARRRGDYDAALRAHNHNHNHHQQQQQGGAGGGQADFQTGIETLDLDDLGFDEVRGVWFRGCRCGNERGFELAEDDLEPAADAGELVVGCRDCSLWLKVHFAVVL